MLPRKKTKSVPKSSWNRQELRLRAARAPFSGQVDRARVTTAKSDIASLSQALDMYKLDNHFYPTTDQGLEALVSRPQSSPEPRNWNPEGYIKGNKLPLDPWDGEYVYMSPGEDNRPYELISLGADARLGGEGYAADISSSDR